jgi:RNA polymerase sigma factor (sigma-70 family)
MRVIRSSEDRHGSDPEEFVAALPEQQRTAVTGRVLDERSYDELAAELGVSEQVVRTRASRGLAQLRVAIGGER